VLALGWAEVLGATDLVIGVNALDYSGYPDCRPEFIAAFETLANLATRAGVEGARFRIHTPLINLSKADIIRRGLALGLDYGLTHSCYNPDDEGRACGRCDSCVLRARGSLEAGLPDPGTGQVESRSCSDAEPSGPSETGRPRLQPHAAGYCWPPSSGLATRRVSKDGPNSARSRHRLPPASPPPSTSIRCDLCAGVHARATRCRAVLDPVGAQRLFASVLREQPSIVNIALADGSARLLATAGSPSPSQVPVLDFVREALRGDRPVLSDLFVAPSSLVPMVVLAHPVHDAAGGLVGLLGLALDLPRIQGAFSSIPLPRGSVVTVMDRSGSIIARSRDAERYVGRTGIPASTSADAPSIRDLDGVERLAADAVLRRVPWRVSVGIPLSEVRCARSTRGPATSRPWRCCSPRS
jgi:hypothetical protein